MPMEHDGHEMDSIYSRSPESQCSPSPNLMEVPSTSSQIPVSSSLSNETPTVVMEGLNQMEALFLEHGTIPGMSLLNILQFMQRLRQLLCHHGAHGRRNRRCGPPA
jgi:hypothetical protein